MAHLTESEKRQREAIVKRLKGKPGINPYAVATATVLKERQK